MQKSMRISFVHSADRLYSETQMFGVHFLPVWAYTLASHLADLAGIQMQLVDDRIDLIEQAREAEFFLYSGINQDISAILKNRNWLAKKYPRAKHLIGGPIAWSFQKAGKLPLLQEFDHIFVGDGEYAIRDFFSDKTFPWPQIVEAKNRFPLSQSKPMHIPMLNATAKRYYGSVIEVSRGCPFLCEFCDIRVLPDNNRSHNKDPKVILQEIDYFSNLGVSQIILACDNFLGNSKWAEKLCDEIIEWKKRSGFNPSFYTWLSIDIARHPVIMQKLKLAGIDMLFIGVESFHRSSLLETSKLQNTSISMVHEIRRIQSYGLIVVAGLIFGFDTDPKNIVEITLKGIRESGLISGDPSLLTALPGTPLYHRMNLSERLRAGKIGLGGFKYQTNIKYLKPEAQIIADFLQFSAEFNSGEFQYSRLKSFFECLQDSQISKGKANQKGFGNIYAAIKMVAREKKSALLFAKRLCLLVGSPVRLYFISKAAILTFRNSTPERALWFYFKFWLFNWSNSLMKYSEISANDFDIGSVGSNYDWNRILPEKYEEDIFEPIPIHKIKHQRKTTAESLKKLIAERYL